MDSYDAALARSADEWMCRGDGPSGDAETSIELPHPNDADPEDWREYQVAVYLDCGRVSSAEVVGRLHAQRASVSAPVRYLLERCERFEVTLDERHRESVEVEFSEDVEEARWPR